MSAAVRAAYCSAGCPLLCGLSAAVVRTVCCNVGCLLQCGLSAAMFAVCCCNAGYLLQCGISAVVRAVAVLTVYRRKRWGSKWRTPEQLLRSKKLQASAKSSLKVAAFLFTPFSIYTSSCEAPTHKLHYS